ncbi:MAG TPA: exodeoxyribonuclease V subunit gamma, partial [Gammaproteobacteria bacterium]|nr:exodeoxyribonuclease V subunit gamma [Gammaproteobacteria bacterium]
MYQEYEEEAKLALIIESGNQLEKLQYSLITEICRAQTDPFVAETVVVPNPGMGRWLLHRFAIHQGIVANVELPLPAGFFWRVVKAWFPHRELSPFDKETLAWRIQAKLPALMKTDSFASLRHYLEGDDPDLRLFQLSRKIADVFDQYLVFRPEMVLAWEEKGENSPDQWQSVLWRAITEEENSHRARVLLELSNEMDKSGQVPEGLPSRVHFFGLNALPPVYLEILDRSEERR